MKKLLITGGSGFIGTEVVNLALEDGWTVCILDIKAPREPGHADLWRDVDIRDVAAVNAAFADFQPHLVMHLASDIDVNIVKLEDFTTTIDGTRNIVNAVAATPSIKRFLHTSTQFVVKPGVAPENETFFDPYTVYGEAKAETEKILRAAQLPVDWVIMRPTIIWGPHHPSFASQIFKHIGRRTYLHPADSEPIMRAFGYVGNTASQMMALATKTPLPNKRVFYLGDEVQDYDVWADAFSIGLTGKKARRIPVGLLKAMGAVGDVVKSLGLRSPIDSGRAFRMSTSSAIDLEETHLHTGRPKIGFDEGVKATLAWIREAQGPAAKP